MQVNGGAAGLEQLSRLPLAHLLELMQAGARQPMCLEQCPVTPAGPPPGFRRAPAQSVTDLVLTKAAAESVVEPELRELHLRAAVAMLQGAPAGAAGLSPHDSLSVQDRLAPLVPLSGRQHALRQAACSVTRSSDGSASSQPRTRLASSHTCCMAGVT